MNSASAEKIGAIILAAGSSSRLGEPKQFLRHHGETLVLRAAKAALAAGCLPVVVVAGDAEERIRRELAELEVNVHHHAEWQRGIGSSIRYSCEQALLHQPTLDALLIMVCDQPFVTADLLQTLIAARAKARTRAAACTYAGTTGVPAVFDRTLFPALAALSDNQGAKTILSSIPDEITRIDFPPGSFDIDTPADARAHLSGR